MDEPKNCMYSHVGCTFKGSHDTIRIHEDDKVLHLLTITLFYDKQAKEFNGTKRRLEGEILLLRKAYAESQEECNQLKLKLGLQVSRENELETRFLSPKWSWLLATPISHGWQPSRPSQPRQFPVQFFTRAEQAVATKLTCRIEFLFKDDESILRSYNADNK